MNNIKWIGKNTIEKMKSPLQTVGKMNGSVKNVIIALHGFGDTAANFAHLADQVNLSDVLWLFIEGPKPVPMSFDGAQWFSLFSDPKEEIVHSENLIFELLETVLEYTGITSEKIFILGFSQGAGMALYYGLKSSKRFAGIIALSGFIVQQTLLRPIIEQKNDVLPIFLGQGLQDQVVFPVFFYETKSILQSFNSLKVTAKTYKMGHNISQEEISDVKKFIEGHRA